MRFNCDITVYELCRFYFAEALKNAHAHKHSRAGTNTHTHAPHGDAHT